MAHLRFSEISAPRGAFVRECQRIDFGKITGLAVRNSEPVFSGDTYVLIDVKLDTDETPRPEQRLTDFLLSNEVVRLFAKLDAIHDGVIENIEVRAGIPRRIVYRCSAQTDRNAC
jgi:hypothetical protein